MTKIREVLARSTKELNRLAVDLAYTSDIAVDVLNSFTARCYIELGPRCAVAIVTYVGERPRASAFDVTLYVRDAHNQSVPLDGMTYRHRSFADVLKMIPMLLFAYAAGQRNSK